MDRDYAGRYAELHRRHWWWRARERFLLSLLRELAPSSGSRILDVGCGDGLFFDKLREFGDVRGVEADGSLVRPDGSHRDRITVGAFGPAFECADRFDLILLLDVLEHLEAPAEALRRAAELMAPGGFLMVTVPAFACLWTSHDEINRHRVRYKKEELTRLLLQAGLGAERCSYFFHWLALAKLMVQWKERLLPGHPGLPRPGPSLLGGVLYGLSVAEQTLAPAARIPFGSSLVAVARRVASDADAVPDRT